MQYEVFWLSAQAYAMHVPWELNCKCKTYSHFKKDEHVLHKYIMHTSYHKNFSMSCNGLMDLNVYIEYTSQQKLIKAWCLTSNLEATDSLHQDKFLISNFKLTSFHLILILMAILDFLKTWMALYSNVYIILKWHT